MLASLVVEEVRARIDKVVHLDLGKFYTRIQRDGTYIIDYRVRLQAMGQEVLPTWRAMGAGESNVDKSKRRLGGRSFSDEGLWGLGHCLVALLEERLLSSGAWPKEVAPEKRSSRRGPDGWSKE
ncbi:hypothetical protein J2Z49_000479 [Desulfofundulus luciae]|uniref:Uncharacterized protein n=1 Tax=Desulfofundulus luciae TaxID=74702 RepID=A0ABU0AY36_9FIRM|nr:hypothetical protein [Desulfofundulus luciae]MDQ0285386.1 hypothetical protein [Desulfofundulus luciae]